MREVIGFLVIIMCAAALMLLAELLHRILRGPKSPQRPTSQALAEEFFQDGVERYSVRHLERFFLVAFVWFLAFFLLMTHEKDVVFEAYLSLNSVPLILVIIASVGVWWAYRRGTML